MSDIKIILDYVFVGVFDLGKHHEHILQTKRNSKRANETPV